MTNPSILVVEDELPIRSLLRFALERANYSVLEAEGAQQAHQIIVNKAPDLILMDWMLPQMSGVELTRRLKENSVTRSIPIIMLTAKAEEDNKILGLDAGADDYVTKPFSPRELLARVRAILRRGPVRNPGEKLEIGELCLDLRSHRVSIENNLIKLGPLEFKLLRFFMEHEDRVFSRDELLDHVWGANSYVDERTVDVHIRRLRKALKPGGYDRSIQTVHGSGYRFTQEKVDA